MDEKSLIVHFNPKSPISEAYRVLRTNIQFSGVDKSLKALVVTSSEPGEGKTTTIVNLAFTFVQSGSKVLVIDADMRKPKVHRMFNFSNQSGLTNVLATKEDYTKLIHRSPAAGLDILTSGPVPPNPSELLSSNSMKMFIERVKEDYDMVFIDAPPVGSVTDAAIISTIVDGTILVIASAKAHIDGVERAKELLEKVNANIIGVVLNKLDKNSQGNYYYYYYYGEDTDSKTPQKTKKKSKKDE